ncbi:deoxyhypusine hydroxylase [Nemania sp. FL0031]|nr:deoxyhypusine hydroxylase [Nemania sp. FL0031]
MPSETDTQAIIASLCESLCSEPTPLGIRFRALFSLKHLTKSDNGDAAVAAIEAIAAAFPSPSALLKHELAYCLGQSANLAAVPPLRKVLKDLKQDPMSRHEAAEALGALGDASNIDFLQEFRDCEVEPRVIRETCEIAIERLKWLNSEERKQEEPYQSKFDSIDPAPPLRGLSVEKLEKILMDTNERLFTRYRAMFGLRDLASPPTLSTAVPAVHALAGAFKDDSPLLRHEIAFVFGQLSHPESIPALQEVLSNVKEEGMVRHEAAEALGSLGDHDGVEDTLKRFLDDEEVVVRDSVIVALDMADFEQSHQMEYALIPELPKIAV